MTILVPVGVCLVLTGTALGDHYFRDEFYYLACSRHMAWGYVDQPPLSIGILWVIRHLAGDSLIVLRVAAALVLAITIWLTGRMAKRLGGSPFAQVLAMTATAIAPELLAVGSYYSMNVFDLLFWTLAASILIEALESPRAGRWALLGVVLGAGLDNKISTLWLGAGIAVGLTLTSARRLLLTPGPWIAAAAAAALFAPHVIWQIATGWPTLEFIRNASRDKMQLNTPVRFIADQIMNMHPVTLPIWFGGLVFLLFARRAERVRPLGVAFLTVAVILILNRTSRSGYLAPAYPVMFAAGGAALDGLIRSAAMRGAAVGLLILAGAATAPLAIPLLSADAYVRYSGALGVAPSTEEKKELGRLPQFFADRQGWDRFVGQVAAVFDRLPPDERTSAAALVGNYGEAGAIEQLGRGRGLRAISGHNNYWLWGPDDASGDILIVLSRSRERQEQRFASVELAGEIDCGDCMPYENHLSIFICRRMKPLPSTRDGTNPAADADDVSRTLRSQWPSFKHYE